MSKQKWMWHMTFDPKSREKGSAKQSGSKRSQGRPKQKTGRWQHTYAAIDLGTNNCRLLIAKPHANSFRVIDSFSRTVRLGEGLVGSGRLSEAAMNRTLDALDVCAEKLSFRGVTRTRAIATEACRLADNGADFIGAIRNRTGISFDIIHASEEARLAVAGCASLLDRTQKAALIFDIGGGSTELVWLDLSNISPKPDYRRDAEAIVAWRSLPFGVVNMAERYGGRHVTPEIYNDMVRCVAEGLDAFDVAPDLVSSIGDDQVQLLGTSGTVTTLAGVYLGLERYERNRVDGIAIDMADIMAITDRLVHSSYEQRVAEPCVGEARADLVLAGCAILEAIHRRWSCKRLRVADRGLREGMLLALMDKADREARARSRNWMNRRRQRRPGGGAPSHAKTPDSSR